MTAELVYFIIKVVVPCLICLVIYENRTRIMKPTKYMIIPYEGMYIVKYKQLFAYYDIGENPDFKQWCTDKKHCIKAVYSLGRPITFATYDDAMFYIWSYQEYYESLINPNRHNGTVIDANKLYNIGKSHI